MSATAAPLLPLQARESQRLGATLALSLLVHALLILGVGFAVSDKAALVPTLEVIFSQTQTALTPKQADFLAQANQQGGGDHDKAQRPRDNQAGIVPQPQAGLSPVPQQRQDAASPPPPRRGWCPAATAPSRWPARSRSQCPSTRSRRPR